MNREISNAKYVYLNDKAVLRTASGQWIHCICQCYPTAQTYAAFVGIIVITTKYVVAATDYLSVTTEW